MTRCTACGIGAWHPEAQSCQIGGCPFHTDSPRHSRYDRAGDPEMAGLPPTSLEDGGRQRARAAAGAGHKRAKVSNGAPFHSRRPHHRPDIIARGGGE